MAAGMRIDDHKSWIGNGSKGVVFPAGAKMKEESDDGSGGHINQYEDTTEKIKLTQENTVKKMKAYPPKETYRN